MRWCVRLSLLLLPLVLCGQNLAVQELELQNGMKVMLLPRPGSGMVAAGWIAKVGSVNEQPGITGISHLFEHMMFKGTHVIGTRNIEEDLRIQLEMDRVKAGLRKEEQALAQRLRLGEIASVKDPKLRTARHQELLAKFEELTRQGRALIVKDEFDRIYTGQGAAGMNAMTSNDITLYFVNLPSNRLELWFWLESDRLMNPVFREFYSERDVVYEERRMSLESTPTGRFMEQFDALFWKSSPYGWPVVGWPSDLDALTREDANDYYARYYAPNNLAACIVGDFEPARAKALAEQYFGRMKRGIREPEPVRTTEVAQIGEQRMTGYADSSPQVMVRYHTVADGHKDEPALRILGNLLSGNTGRLYRSLVLEQQVANMAFAGQGGRKYEGQFSLSGTAKQGKAPEQVEQALYKEIEKLQKEPVPERELQKIKNNLNASQFRQMQADQFLMMRLLMAESNRGWRAIESDAAELQAVTPADIQRVAGKYFSVDNRNVLILYTKPGASGRGKRPAAASQPGGPQ